MAHRKSTKKSPGKSKVFLLESLPLSGRPRIAHRLDSSTDTINPPHYRSHPSGVECIQITEHMNFNLGNAIKYIWRAGEKPNTPVELDLRKAIWYIEREIARRASK